jgi:hypothetical protein
MENELCLEIGFSDGLENIEQPETPEEAGLRGLF